MPTSTRGSPMLDTRQVTGESLGSVTSAGALDADSVGVKQFSFRELTYRRFMNHPLAKWAALALVIIVIACYGAPVWHVLFPNYIQAPDQYSLLDAGQGPSLRHLFGLDNLNGHDIFSLVLYGGRLSLFVGIGSMIVAVGIRRPFRAVGGCPGRPLRVLLVLVY